MSRISTLVASTTLLVLSKRLQAFTVAACPVPAFKGFELATSRLHLRQIDLAVLPLSIGLIIVSTMLPVEFRPPGGWGERSGAFDLLQNLLLFLPLGWALRGRSSPWVSIIATALSCSAELSQIWSFERFPSPYDVIANVGGALVGWILARCYQWPDRISIGPRLLLLMCVLVIAIATLWNVPLRAARPLTFQPDFTLVLGNEATGDRPWKGQILALSILSGKVSGTQLQQWIREPKQMLDGELYQLREAVQLGGTAGVIIEPQVAARIARSINENGAFTVLARVTTDDVDQRGPARIISFASDPLHGNFDLGQQRDEFVFRVRSPANGLEDEDVEARSRPIVAGRAFTLIATYDSAVARLYVNGELQGRMNGAAAHCISSWACDAGLALGWSIFGGVTTLALLFLLPITSRLECIAVALVGAMLAIVIPRTFGWVPEELLSLHWQQLGAAVGALAIAIRPTTSVEKKAAELSTSGRSTGH